VYCGTAIMKDTRFSKILTEGTRGTEGTGATGSAASSQGESSPNGDAGGKPSLGSEPAHASLYDDTLRRKADSSWRTVLTIVFVLLFAGGLIAFFAGRSSDTKPLIRLQDVPAEEAAQPAEASGQTPAATEPTAPPAAAVPKPTDVDPSPSAKSATDVHQIAARGPAPDAGSQTSSSSTSADPPEASSQHRTTTQKESAESTRPKVAEHSSPRAAIKEQPEPAPTAPEVPKPTQPEEAASSSESSSAVAAAETDGGGESTAQSTLRGSEDYQQLLQHSSVAAKLVAGGISTLSFESWRVVQQTDSETWIDLIGRWNSSGDEVHFIWSVNRSSGAVRPLSEAARNLEHTDS
jgi:hypothetical protein